MKKGNDIDNLFKEGLEHPDIPFNSADWQAMDERLYPKQKLRIEPVIWFATVSGLAAMLLIVFYLINPAVKKSNHEELAKNKVEKKRDLNTGASSKIRKENKPALEDRQKTEILKENELPAEKLHASAKHYGLDGLIKTQESKNTLTEPFDSNNNQLANNTLGVNERLSIENTNQLAVFNAKISKPADFGKSKDKLINKNSFGKPRLILSILAAPDLTSIQSSGRSNLSGSIGAELMFSLTKRLSFTTGVAYAKKIYESDFSLYRPNSSYVFGAVPTNVHANCDVLDIPLNVNYKIFDGNRNSISVSTGLSSYLMLKEKYTYTYNSVYPGPASYQVKNQNQHYLGIANIGVEFQHKINSKLSISARPFMKIPLMDIGYGNTKLSSTGVAVSVNMNLFRKAN